MQFLRISKGVSIPYANRSDRARLLSSKVYQELAKSKRLLSKDAFDNLSQLVVTSGEVRSLLGMTRGLSEVAEALRRGVRTREVLAQHYDTLVSIEQAGLNSSESLLDGMIYGSEVDPRAIVRLCKKLSKRIVEKNESMLGFEVGLQGALGLREEFADRRDLYVCKCGMVTEIRALACTACNKKAPSSPRALLQTTSETDKIIKDSVWLELAVAERFKSKGYDVIVGGTFLGKSGVEHELDVVATLKDTCSVEVEVTSGEVDLFRLAKVALRMQEFPFQKYALVALGPIRKDNHLARIARFHGIGLFPDIRNGTVRLERWIDALPTIHH